MRQTHNAPPGATLEDPPFLEGATVSIRLLVSLKRASRCETVSAARSLQQIVRLAVLRAPSTLGGSADNMRRQVLELMTMAQRHSLSSFAIDSVMAPLVATLGNESAPERFPGCDNGFGAELISPIPQFLASV